MVTEPELLRFHSNSASQQPDTVTRLIDASDFVASAYSANKLSWNVGEQMTNKELIIYGADTNDYSSTDYSLDNKRCEPSRSFIIDLVHQVGYSPAVVAETRSSMNVEIVDDDFYGKVDSWS